MTCPINVKTQDEARIFILQAGHLCKDSKPFGYPAISYQPIPAATAKRQYQQCSGVIPHGQREKTQSHVATYLWHSSLENERDRDRIMQSLFGRVAGGLIASGLPVETFLSVNNVFCFEVDAAFDKDPLMAIKDINVSVPASIRQVARPNATCSDLLGATYVTGQ
jgi:hypothetical protein